MKKLLTIIGIILISTSVNAQMFSISAIDYDAGKVFVGVRKTDTGEFESKLKVISLADYKIEEILLTPEISERDILAVMSDGEALVLVTQITTGDTDDPEIYVRHKGKVWSKFSTMACGPVMKSEIKKNKLTVYCEIDKKGKIELVKKEILLKEIKFKKDKVDIHAIKTKDFDLQMTEVDARYVEIKIKPQKGDIKVITAKELF